MEDLKYNIKTLDNDNPQKYNEILEALKDFRES